MFTTQQSAISSTDLLTQLPNDMTPGLPPKQGLYDPRFEHDACGIGFVTHVEGRRSHTVVEMALEALANHSHRGAVADDRKTGDGAGILTQLPYEFFNRELRRLNIEPPPIGDLAVGQLYLFRQDEEDRKRAKVIIMEVLQEFNLDVLAFRSVPVIDSALGARAESTRPWMEQVFVRRNPHSCTAGDEFERLLYLARKTIVNRSRAEGVQRLYIPSLSSRTIVYKGLVLAGELAHIVGEDLSGFQCREMAAALEVVPANNVAAFLDQAARGKAIGLRGIAGDRGRHIEGHARRRFQPTFIGHAAIDPGGGVEGAGGQINHDVGEHLILGESVLDVRTLRAACIGPAVEFFHYPGGHPDGAVHHGVGQGLRFGHL